jgi:hypothetical protein
MAAVTHAESSKEEENRKDIQIHFEKCLQPNPYWE